MTKIAVLTPDLAIHGVSTFVLDISQILDQAGHDVTVVTFQQDLLWHRLGEYNLKGACVSLRGWGSAAGHVQSVAKYLSEERFDVVLANVVSRAKPVQQALKLLPDRVIAVPIAHNDQSVVYDLVGINADAWNLAVAISPKVQQTLAKRLPHKEVRCIPHGIMLPSVHALAQRRGWEPHLRLLFVGRLANSQKNILLLPVILETSLRKGINVSLTVIGDGVDRAAFEQACASHGVSHLVNMQGYQSKPEVYAAMQEHHILLLPSHFEGLGLVLLEAQANGCVPVASNLPGVTDSVIEDGVTGLLAEPGNAQHFAEQVATLMNPARWQALSQAARKQVHHHFSVEVMGKHYLQLLEEIQQGAHPLSTARSLLRKRTRSSFTWRDHVPRVLLSLQHRLRRKLGLYRSR
jgi:glycosyltransferase involved in cell wall biosynthesis